MQPNDAEDTEHSVPPFRFFVILQTKNLNIIACSLPHSRWTELWPLLKKRQFSVRKMSRSKVFLNEAELWPLILPFFFSKLSWCRWYLFQIMKDEYFKKASQLHRGVFIDPSQRCGVVSRSETAVSLLMNLIRLLLPAAQPNLHNITLLFAAPPLVMHSAAKRSFQHLFNTQKRFLSRHFNPIFSFKSNVTAHMFSGSIGMSSWAWRGPECLIFCIKLK